MIKGMLVVNHYLVGEKFTELNKWILESAKNNDINLSIVTNREIMVGLGDICCDIDFVLFWDKDILLAEYLEKNGLRVFNSSYSIGVCDDKALTYVTLCMSGIRMPKTIIAPLSFFELKEIPDYLNEVGQTLGYPLIIKERFGSFGYNVYLAADYYELEKIFMEKQNNKLIFQEYIRSSYGKDIRVHVVGDKVVTAMLRINNSDFRANVTNGATMQKIDITKEQEQMAIDTARALKLDFAGVDILFGENDEPYLCEVNSNAHFINIYGCTGVNVADKIFEYIKQKI